MPRAVVTPTAEPGPTGFGDTVQPLRELQRRYVLWAFERCGGSKRATCEALGIDYKTLMRWLGER